MRCKNTAYTALATSAKVVIFYAAYVSLFFCVSVC